MRLNYELLAICLNHRCVLGALKRAYQNKLMVCANKHAGGKNIKQRKGKTEHQYGKSLFLRKVLKDVKANYDFLVQNEIVNPNKSMMFNLNQLQYTEEEAKEEYEKFCKSCNVYEKSGVCASGYYISKLFEF